MFYEYVPLAVSCVSFDVNVVKNIRFHYHHQQQQQLLQGLGLFIYSDPQVKRIYPSIFSVGNLSHLLLRR
jgi:hypothetical protein